MLCTKSPMPVNLDHYECEKRTLSKVDHFITVEQYMPSRDNWPATRYIFWPMFREIFRNGDAVKGKSVLDVGCGYGICVKQFLEWGTSRYVGLDLSEDEIVTGRHRFRDLLGDKHEMLIASADDFHIPEKFDIAISCYLFHCMLTKEAVFQSCKRVYEHLKEGGKFVFVNPTWDEGQGQPEDDGPKTGTRFRCYGELKDEAVIKATLYRGTEPCDDFRAQFLYRSTYVMMLKEAGFRTVECVKPRIDANLPEKEYAEKLKQLKGHVDATWYFIATK